MTVELSTRGDLKFRSFFPEHFHFKSLCSRIFERPQSMTIGPFDETIVHHNIKISSTESSYIFGTISYEDSSDASKHFITLSDIHLDVMTHIRPATCSQEEFRRMWSEFEWENRLVVNTHLSSPSLFLSLIASSTNMTTLQSHEAPGLQASQFLSATLYAKSVFNEDALMNISIERDEKKKLVGVVRIRAKTQGIALSLGDRVTEIQRTSTT